METGVGVGQPGGLMYDESKESPKVGDIGVVDAPLGGVADIWADGFGGKDVADFPSPDEELAGC